MIIQGSNSPVQVMFDDLSSIVDYSIALIQLDERHHTESVLKHWGTGDLEFDGNTVYAPLTEHETLSFPPGVVSLEIKWIDEDSDIYHTKVYRLRIAPRGDHTEFGATQNEMVDV